jgi:RimJ/RimL family protein N-acetyltransferase
LPSLGKFIKEVDADESEEFPHYIFFSVCERGTDTFFGEVGLVHVDFVNRTAETASWLQRPEFRAQGYGSEAKHLLLEYTFDTLGFHMVESCVRFENTRSSAALRKQGYREAGRIGWMSNRDGAFSNFVTFDLLADEWRALSLTSD